MKVSDPSEFNKFTLKDQRVIQQFVDISQPISCEYNFSNLFCWQVPSELSWTMYQERLLIYDNIDRCAFMPLGEKLSLKELVKLSQYLKNIGLKPDFSLVTEDYLNEFPELEKYYIITKEPDYAEYIYDVNNLSDLKGRKLSKKKNLISQFKRLYPDYTIYPISGNVELQQKAFKFSKKLLRKQEKPLTTIIQEFEALETAIKYFDTLGLDGIAVLVESHMVAFSVFSPLNNSTFDIQFEKADVFYKGSSQIISQKTAEYLENKCKYLNKEQDLGIEGLRKAKLSYDPVNLAVPYSLKFII